MKKHIQTRILLAFSLLLLVIQLTSMLIINIVYSANAHQDIRHDLQRAERIFNLLLENNNRQLTHSAIMMSSDFAFKKSVALADRDTIVSVLYNHGSRLNADVLMLADLDRQLLATRQVNATLEQADIDSLIRQAEESGNASAMAIINKQLHQVVVIPVLGPLPIAWLVAGFKIDNEFATSLQSVTSAQVSFVGKTHGSSHWMLLASSLPDTIKRRLPGFLDNVQNSAQPADGNYDFAVEDDIYQSSITSFKRNGGYDIAVVLQQSLNQALAPLRQLQELLLWLAAVSLLAVLVSGYLIARGISRPIVHLSQLVSFIRKGDYSRQAPVERSDEIGDLASAFNHMQANIADREFRITQLAYKDQLTQLPNRLAFQERLVEIINAAKSSKVQVALLLVNLDRMNQVNTILGHHFGDLLLKEVSRRLSSALPQGQGIIARLGGDEFALILSPADKESTHDLCATIQAILDSPVVLENQEVLPTGSIGIALYPEHGRDPDDLLRRADIAMYQAKKESGTCATFDVAFEETTGKNLSLLAELRHAISRNEFELYYQPKLSLDSRTVNEFEALIRWQHPVHGLIMPGRFIPHAEQTGYIRNITRWVFRAAIERLHAWRNDNWPLRIAVNISARDLANTELPAIFADLLKHYEVSPDWLKLEITESAVMNDPRRALLVLEELKLMGLKLSLDDFGTDQSSLAYLKQLPVSELKIDKSFIVDMTENSQSAAIVRSAIELGHNMGLKVVAEGVENEFAMDLLAEMKCDVVQGYFLSKPVPGDDVLDWLAQSSWKPDFD